MAFAEDLALLVAVVDQLDELWHSTEWIEGGWAAGNEDGRGGRDMWSEYRPACDRALLSAGYEASCNATVSFFEQYLATVDHTRLTAPSYLDALWHELNETKIYLRDRSPSYPKPTISSNETFELGIACGAFGEMMWSLGKPDGWQTHLRDCIAVVVEAWAAKTLHGKFPDCYGRAYTKFTVKDGAVWPDFDCFDLRMTDSDVTTTRVVKLRQFIRMLETAVAEP